MYFIIVVILKKGSEIMKYKLLSSLLASAPVFGGLKTPSFAQEAENYTSTAATIVHSGKIGTADWTIDSNGVLAIGEGEYDNSDQDEITWPWTEYLDAIKTVDGTAAFKIIGSLENAFENAEKNSVSRSFRLGYFCCY